MITHNTKTEPVVSQEKVSVVSEREKARVLKSRLNRVTDLAISEDDDAGSDPYNNTGHHITIKTRLDPLD